MPTVAEFRALRRFILARGDRMTYCNMYNCNPHFAFEGFEAFLNPDVGQRNINCDPKLSGFDELVIYDWNSEPQYFRVKLRGEALICDDGVESYFARMLKVIPVD